MCTGNILKLTSKRVRYEVPFFCGLNRDDVRSTGVGTTIVSGRGPVQFRSDNRVTIPFAVTFLSTSDTYNKGVVIIFHIKLYEHVLLFPENHLFAIT